MFLEIYQSISSKNLFLTLSISNPPNFSDLYCTRPDEYCCNKNISLIIQKILINMSSNLIRFFYSFRYLLTTQFTIYTFEWSQGCQCMLFWGNGTNPICDRFFFICLVYLGLSISQSYTIDKKEIDSSCSINVLID